MKPATAHRTLIVANRTAATQLLLEEVERRARERPTHFALLIPNVPSGDRADWTMERAIPLLERAARGPVEGITGGADPFESVKQALDDGRYDDVLISTLPRRTSEWLRRDLPRKVQRLGVPVAVISQEEERSAVREAAQRAGGAAGGGPI
jgi:hypothetical protein